MQGAFTQRGPRQEGLSGASNGELKPPSSKQQTPKQQSPKQNGAKLSSRATSRTFSGLMADVPACLSFSDLSNCYPADFQSEYGPNHASRELVRTARRVVVKIGTACVTRGQDSRLALGRLGALVEQLETLVRGGREIILVTSGGVSVGRQKLRQQKVLNSSPLEMQFSGGGTVPSRAAAAAGQSGLMALYDSLFGMMDLQAAQVLVTRNDFTDPTFKENLVTTVEDLLGMNVVPVFNENDAISKGVMKSTVEGPRVAFRDNDGLAALLAIELKADLLILLTDVAGLYDGPPADPNSNFIPTYCPEVHDDLIKFGDPSSGGRGGMVSKLDAAWMAASAGVSVVIASGKEKDGVLQVTAGNLVGTLFNREAAQKFKQEWLRSQKEEAMEPQAPAENTGPRDMAVNARTASRALQNLSSKQRERLLHKIADNLLAKEDEIMQENEKDCQEAKGKISEQLMQRLKLKPQKIKQLADGLRSIAAQEEPIGKTLSRMEIAEGLQLQKVTAPIGVLLIIFEARPDALPQIAALAIRSGNGLLLKGGKEAARSNACLHKIITDTIAQEQPEVGRDVISLITSRANVDELLKLNDVIDLVIPRGSNALVTHIQQNTKIAVLGHADGICHIYVDPDCDIDMACKICIDSKIDYPAACNAVEKILVHEDLAKDGRLYKLQSALRQAGVTMYGGERASHTLSIERAKSDRCEYGEAEVTLELVESMDEAIDHLHAHGSGHTECIVTDNKDTAEEFLKRVDAACVNHNATTRFSDGFRFGLGAEVGISTSRIHARGPVGVEGLLTTRFLLRGSGQTVEKDAHIKYTHKPLPLKVEEAGHSDWF
ncbi:Delta-1-pyrroline-5-carboxylate synthase [Trebouxia sp. C0010 RCD-2024]